MRFAFCIFKYFPYGGIQRDLMKFLQECAKRGHTCKIFCLRWEAPPPQGFELEVIPIVGVTRHAQYEHFAQAVRARIHEERFDLIVGFNKIPGLDVYYAGDSCYAEKSLTQRNALYRLLPRYRSFCRLERAVFDKTSHTEILTLSDVEIPRYRHHYRTNPARFHALPPGIEEDRVAPPDRLAVRAQFRREFGFAEDERLLLFVGSGFIKKGLDRALLAMQALPPALLAKTRLLVVGRDRSDAFARMAMRLGLKDRVDFHTEGRDDVPRFMFACDGLIHPAYDEAAGMVIIEAMLAGLPALVTRNCGYAKYLAEQDAGIVLSSPFAQDELNAALIRLLTSDERVAWQRNGLAAGSRKELFEMATAAVDYLEEFARRKSGLLVFTLFRYFPYGGMQRDFLRIALACRTRGYRVLVYCLSWQGDIPDGLEVVTFETSALTNTVRHQQFAELVAKDLSWRVPTLVIGFNKMPGLDIYYAADSCYEHKAQQMRTPLYRTTRRYRHLAEFEKAVFAGDRATRVMLVAPNQREQYRRYYDIDDSRFYQLPPGVVKDRMRSDQWLEQRCAIRREFGIAPTEFLLVTIGSGFITKGVDRVIRALADLEDRVSARLLVIGQSDASAFERLARQLGVFARVTFVSGRDDIPAVLQGADLMVHPAYMESGGMVLIEAIIAGLPVIATSVCGFAHYIEDARAGVVIGEPFDPQALSAAVRNALEDEPQRALWSANGVEYGRTHPELYDMPQHALEFIERCVNDLSA